MSIERVRQYLAEYGAEGKILELSQSSATVELAAAALGVEPARIAKTLSFEGPSGCILIVAAGDTRIDNSKFKNQFHRKAKMLAPDQVEALIGHSVGGVCPFAVNRERTEVFLDRSLQRFQTVFPACGSSNSAIELSCEELYAYSEANGWVDVTRGPDNSSGMN